MSVFFRSMRVLIFAGALLVGETVSGISQNRLNWEQKLVKELCRSHLDLRFHLKIWQGVISSMISSGKSLNHHFPNRIQEVRTVLHQSEEVLNVAGYFMGFDLDPIYEKDNFGATSMFEELPRPYGPNVIKATRVKRFVEYLHGLKSGGRINTDQLVEVVENQSAPELEAEISKLMGRLASSPIIDATDRFALLGRNYAKVSLEELQSCHGAMQEKLKKYVEGVQLGKDVYSKEDMANLVLLHLLKFENGQASSAILDDLDDLYIQHRFYRIAVSEEHIVYVRDRPNTYRFVTTLKSTIKTLNRFALVLSSATELFDSKGMLDGNILEIKTKLAKKKVRIAALFKPFIVFNLKRTLEREFPDFINLTNRPSGGASFMQLSAFWRLGARVLEEVQHRLKIYRTYAAMKSLAIKNESVTMIHPARKATLYTDLTLLSVLLDETSQDLNAYMISEDLEKLCDSAPKNFNHDPNDQTEWDFVGHKVTVICKTSWDLVYENKENPKSGVTTFSSLLRKRMSRTCVDNLQKVSLEPFATVLTQSDGELLMESLKALFTQQFEHAGMLEQLASQDVAFSFPRLPNLG